METGWSGHDTSLSTLHAGFFYVVSADVYPLFCGIDFLNVAQLDF